MQFVTSMQRFAIRRAGTGNLVLIVVSMVALATLAVWQMVNASVFTSSEARAPQIVAHYNPNMGEGRLDVGQVTIPAHKAHDNPYMGEGRSNVERSTARRPIVHDIEGQGEGWLAYGKPRDIATERASTVIGCGQGEGLLNLNIPHDDVCERR